MEFGYLVVYRKNKASAPYELDQGEHTIGSSVNSNIRLKLSHPLLLETHAVIRVNEIGIATIINKSISAPVKVNGKLTNKSIILKHEDKFEILEKVFQYFNDKIKNEPEDSEKFLKEKKNIWSKNRQSAHPLSRTPAKKSPNLKTKISSTKKRISADNSIVVGPGRGVQVIITPNNKQRVSKESQTTSKIIVSKALASPPGARKRRLSLNDTKKTSQSPKVSSRNILLSKSTINITISQEHEYSEITPSAIPENENLKSNEATNKTRTSKRSIKITENGDTPNKNISVSLIDFNTPDAEKKRGDRKTPVQQPEGSTGGLLSNETSVMKTPVNKRIQSLKTLRHSHKKDTPPPRSSIPNILTESPTAQKRRSSRRITNVTSWEDNDITAEPSKKQRVSVFDESTVEMLPEFDKNKSTRSISILDDTEEVLSPVQTLSLRSEPSQNVESGINSSTRRSSLKRGTKKSQTLQDSSLTTTSLDQSSSSVISVSSQSFSSFKRGSSRRDGLPSESEIIDVVNVSSTMETPGSKRRLRSSSGVVKEEVFEEDNLSRSSIRQSRTSEMFRDVTCTSTPFHKQSVNKKSKDAEFTVDKVGGSDSKGGSARSDKSRDKTLSSNVASSSRRLEMISNKTNGSASNIFDEPVTVRRSSSRTRLSTNGDEDNCISCRTSSVKRSRSLSTTNVATSAQEQSSSSVRASRKSSGSVFKQSYVESSPVKGMSVTSASKTPTPLLHRKSLTTSLSEKTPQKTIDTEEETPKSSIKPRRRSSKANQSTYNPQLEDITPVTPEKLMVSGFTEEVFKTPINTPGLFESIRKSVIRSRKRHRESTGSTMKDSKRARVDFVDDEQQEQKTSPEETERSTLQGKPQKSPLNRLSNFEGVKKLLKTPPKSPKNDLRNVPNLRKFVSPKVQASPQNDLTNVAGVKKMFSTPKEIRSPQNDLTNVPNLRRLMSPRTHKSPKNDLTEIPNLRSIMSPRERKSPKNDLTSPLGVKQLLKTPKVQKEPTNDLTNITGVANIFNVSGVEVLHQGSDIENSEDLFTKLTGKRPVRAYQRGKSTSPNKAEKEQANSRKTMGDIPVCSPRVQQWVNDHANVKYEQRENAHEMPPSEDEDVFFNMSKKASRKSRAGRSVSPEKPLYTRNRRKTQGDMLSVNPNIAAWKMEHASHSRTRKSATLKTPTSAKTNLLSPHPLQTSSLKAGKLTPQQRKTKVEIVTPPQQARPKSDDVTPASIRARNGGAKIVQEDQETSRQQTASNDVVTPASVKTRRGAPKQLSQDQQIHELLQTETVTTSSNSTRTPKGAVIVSQTDLEPSGIVTKRGGRRGRRIMSNEELDVVTSTTVSPIQESKKNTKIRRGDGKVDESRSVEQEGTTKDTDSTKVFPSPVKRGRPRGQKVEEKVPTELEKQAKKPATRTKVLYESEPQIGEDEVHTETEVHQKPTTSRSRRGKKVEDKFVEPVPAPNKAEMKKSASKRGKKVVELQQQELVENLDEEKVAKKPKRGQKIDELQETIPLNAVEQSKEPGKKPATEKRGKKMAQVNENKETPGQTIEAEVLKPAPRGRRDKKEQPEESYEDKINENEKPKLQKLTRGKKEKKAKEARAIEISNEMTEEVDVRKSSRSRRRQKQEIKADQEDILLPESESIKDATRETETLLRRRGRKLSNQDEDLNINPGGDVEFKKPTRGRPKKDECNVSNTPTKGKRELKEKDPLSSDNVEDKNSLKKATTKRGRGKKVDMESETPEKETEKPKTAESSKNTTKDREKKEAVPSSKKPPTRSRGKKVEETTEKHEKPVQKETKKARNKIIEEVMEIDVGSPRSTRAKRGVNKKYSTDEYEVAQESKGGSKRKVHFENDSNSNKETPQVGVRTSKRTRII